MHVGLLSKVVAYEDGMEIGLKAGSTNDNINMNIEHWTPEMSNGFILDMSQGKKTSRDQLCENKVFRFILLIKIEHTDQIEKEEFHWLIERNSNTFSLRFKICISKIRKGTQKRSK